MDAEAAASLLEAALFFQADAQQQAEADLDQQLPLVSGYRLTRPLGEGGFGIVYAAEQISPIRRRVALKILRLGFTTRELLARFEQERQALAMMNHPHIARIYDAGETDDGRPFIAMEMVDGTTIDRFPHLTSPEKKVRLLAHVCHAVAHAHQRGVIHRDLKPSNILVTTGLDGEPEPKVIDFGIAKALEEPLITRVLFTGMCQVVGTPGYMGPERQSSSPSGQVADTRSDVFALGAVLWELLSGERPQLITEGETLRIILPEPEPVPHELRWIAAMATAVDMDRRYPDAATLAADLEAWLAGKPVRAAAPGWSYLFGKWARRHPWTAGSLAASLLVLAITTAVVVRQNRRIGEQLLSLQSAAAENLRQSAEQNFLLGRNTIHTSPLEGLLRWQECLRQNPRHPRAHTFLNSALAQHHLVAFLGESHALPAGHWRDLQISPAGTFAAVRGAGADGLEMWAAPRGGAWRTIPSPTPDKEPFVINDEGKILDAKNTQCPIVGLRFLHLTSTGYLAAAGADGYGWRAPNGDWKILPLAQPVREMVVSADGKMLAVAIGGRVESIGLADDSPAFFGSARPAPVSALALSPDGTTLAAGWRDGLIQIMQKGQPLREIAHHSPVLDVFLTQSPQTLVLRDPDGMAWVDLRSQSPHPALHHIAIPHARWALPAGASCAVVSDRGGNLRVIDSQSPGADSGWVLPGVVGAELTAAAEDGLTFVALDEPSQRIRWFRSQPAAATHSPPAAFPENTLCFTAGDAAATITFHRDGTLLSQGNSRSISGGPFRLAAMSDRARIILADRQSREGALLIRENGTTIPRPWPKPSAIAVSPSGQWLAIGTPDGRHAIAPVDAAELTWQSTPTGSPLTALAMRDDGHLARAAGGRVTISRPALNSVQSDQLTFSIASTVTAMAFSPSGDQLAIATADGWLRWHDATTGFDLALPHRISGKIVCMHWSTTGSEIQLMLEGGESVKCPIPTQEPAIPIPAGWKLTTDGQVTLETSAPASEGGR